MTIDEMKKLIAFMEKKGSSGDTSILSGASHDIIFFNINPEEASEEEIVELDAIGIILDEGYDAFVTFV